MTRKERKAIQAVNFFARKPKGHSVDKLKVIKLLWIADRYHLMKYGRTISSDRYHAMPHGPVASQMYSSIQPVSDDYTAKYLKTEKHSIRSLADCDFSVFSQSDLDVLEQVWETFGELNGKQLRLMSHEFPEWKKFEEQLNSPVRLNSFPMDMRDFFETPQPNSLSRSNFFEIDSEIVKDSKEIFLAQRSFERV